MPETDQIKLTAAQERKLKIAAEQICELCYDYFPLSFLKIHRISKHLYKEMKRDPSTRIMVVCDLCHNHIHKLPMPIGKQRAIVRGREFYIRRDMRKILGYKSKPYQAPDDLNLSVIYDEYFGKSPLGSYRISG